MILSLQALPEEELNTYANTIRQNDELISALYDLLEEDLSQEVSVLPFF